MSPRLPNAPLTEVVFEMRWGVMPAPDVPPPFSLDPGNPSIVDTISRFARQNGFDRHEDLRQPVYGGLAHGVSRRFYQGDDRFPLLQIGPGIFAANYSPQYEWESFRTLAEKGRAHFLSNYPKPK